MEHLLTYILELYLDPRRNYKEFGEAMKDDFSDVRLHKKESYVVELLQDSAILRGLTQADLKPTEIW
eukprot:8341554-Karenia_brevis.AAC.1